MATVITESRLRSNGFGTERELYDDPGEVRSLKAGLFGQLVKRCKAVLNSYESDLYHDAIFIEHEVTIRPGFTFLWGFADSHTQIGLDSLVSERLMLSHNRVVYRVEITVTTGGTWGIKWYGIQGCD